VFAKVLRAARARAEAVQPSLRAVLMWLTEALFYCVLGTRAIPLLWLSG